MNERGDFIPKSTGSPDRFRAPASSARLAEQRKAGTLGGSRLQEFTLK